MVISLKLKHDYCFSDREILAFLYDRSKSVPELFGYLREFISDCEDIDLVRLVTSYMKNVETDNERFRHNIASEDRIYQCAIYYEDGSEKGRIYTYDYDIAYQYGKSYQESFTIQKIPIVTKMVMKGGEPEDEAQYYNEKGELLESYVETPKVFYSPIYAPHPFKTGDIVPVVTGYNKGVKALIRLPDREAPVHD